MTEPMRVAGVILAAGASRRFGSPKQLAKVGEQTMLERVADLARDSGLAPIVAVVPSGMRAPRGTRAINNDRPDEGLSRSLRLGIGALPDDVEAAVVLLGDQPTVPRATIEAIVREGRGDRPVVAPRAQGRIGPPVLLRREAFRLVDEASGDSGLGPVLARHPDLVTHVEVPSHAPDVDTPGDLEGLVGPSATPPGG
jgi:molybdenum cofactor cytidylyltransferase